MHVLIAHESKMGGTEGIARRLSETLQGLGVRVTLRAAGDVEHPEDFDAVVVGSALYGGRWRRPAIRLVKMLADRHCTHPVWLFHSGPLGDDEADSAQPLPKKVARLAGRLDVRDRKTFGGRLPEDAKGFIAGSMVRQGRAGDWRDFAEVDAWAAEIARTVIGIGSGA